MIVALNTQARADHAIYQTPAQHLTPHLHPRAGMLPRHPSFISLTTFYARSPRRPHPECSVSCPRQSLSGLDCTSVLDHLCRSLREPPRRRAVENVWTGGHKPPPGRSHWSRHLNFTDEGQLLSGCENTTHQSELFRSLIGEVRERKGKKPGGPVGFTVKDISNICCLRKARTLACMPTTNAL